MATFTYTAKRNISGGRSLNSVYALSMDLVKFDRQAKRKTSSATSLSGQQFTTFHRLDVFYVVQSAPINDSSTLDQVREFLDSVAGGEIFDIDGSDYTLDGDYSDTLVEISGFYTFGFRARAI